MGHAYGRIGVAPVSGALGAEISGVDLAVDLDDETFADVHRALLDHHVLVFRDQDLTPEQQMAFGRRFGDLNEHPFFTALEGYPQIVKLLKEPTAKGNAGGNWHCDLPFTEKPSLGAILYGLEVPPYGGDTLFVNQCLAYDNLSDGLKQALDGRKAIYSDILTTHPDVVRERNKRRTVQLKVRDDWTETAHAHPIVRTHPESRRKSLFMSRDYMVRFADMTAAESAPLLDYLHRHSVRPEHTCRIRWERGTVVMWDNRCTQHKALDDYDGFRRLMHRVDVVGARPM